MRWLFASSLVLLLLTTPLSAQEDALAERIRTLYRTNLRTTSAIKLHTGGIGITQALGR